MAIDSIYQYGKTEQDKAKAIKKADAMARFHKVPFFVGLGTGTFGGYVVANALICDFVYRTDVKVYGQYFIANVVTTLDKANNDFITASVTAFTHPNEIRNAYDAMVYEAAGIHPVVAFHHDFTPEGCKRKLQTLLATCSRPGARPNPTALAQIQNLLAVL